MWLTYPKWKKTLLCATLSTSALLISACGGSSANSSSSSSSQSSTSSSSASSTAASSSVTFEPQYDGVHSWWHEKHESQTSAAVADDHVRRSTVYDVSVATAEASGSEPSFVYMTIPRSGKDKQGYSYEDGAEFSASAGLSMSWSTFLYDTDVWVTIDLKDGHVLQSVDEVTLRPSHLQFEKTLVDSDTVRIRVPFAETGYRFSVEFDHQLMTSYNDQRGNTGVLTEDPAGAEVHTEPRNALLIFAEPMLTQTQRAALIPSEVSGELYAPEQGALDVSAIDGEILYFQPGVYYMASDEHAYLPESVRWVHLAPGAYVKGALQFRNAAQDYKVTGYGVLSGEKYVYQADRDAGYVARDPEKSDCHSSCVKMLEFASANAEQTLRIHGVTIVEPPYHSFVVYGHEDSFKTLVDHYKQVGGWYWQTDGMEIYRNGSLQNSFFHANDDVIKIYHSNTQTDNVVVWKAENGPVIQFGWASRNIDNITVSNVDVIHNRMYWQDQKHNTCIINSADLYSDTPMAKDEVSLANTVSNLTFTNIRAEGKNLCAMRLLALSNWENISIDGLFIDEWSSLPKPSQYSLFKAASTKGGDPQQVQIGEGAAGLSITNYVVDGQPITKSGDYWGSDALGRLNFDGALWDSWSATSDLAAECTPQSVAFTGVPEFASAGTSTTIAAEASSGGPVAFSIADGTAFVDGNVLTFDTAPGGVSVAAEQQGDDVYCDQRVTQGVQVFDPAVGPGARWIGASWAGWSPSNIPMSWDADVRLYRATVELEAGSHAMKITDSDNWSGDDWGAASGLTGVLKETTGGGANIEFNIEAAGAHVIEFDPVTNAYSISGA